MRTHAKRLHRLSSSLTCGVERSYSGLGLDLDGTEGAEEVQFDSRRDWHFHHEAVVAGNHTSIGDAVLGFGHVLADKRRPDEGHVADAGFLRVGVAQREPLGLPSGGYLADMRKLVVGRMSGHPVSHVGDDSHIQIAVARMQIQKTLAADRHTPALVGGVADGRTDIADCRRAPLQAPYQPQEHISADRLVQGP